MRLVDLLITNARIVDGTGAPWFMGSVAVADGCIASVSPRLDLPAGETLDLHGCFLAPGFVDTHTHDDLEFIRHPDRVEKLAQGVTTVVTGNCGFSPFPFVDRRFSDLVDHVSSLLGEVEQDELFANLMDYRRALEQQGLGPNLVPLVGHGALKIAAMGYDDRRPTNDEKRIMVDLLESLFDQGLRGLSLGLVYPPSSYADDEELVVLAGKVAERHGILTAHIRNYEGGLVTAVEEFIRILQASGATGVLSHLQAAGRPYWGHIEDAIALLEKARQDGVDVSFDMYPYLAGSSTILQLLPHWAQEGGRMALLNRLRDPTTRERIERFVDGADDTDESKVALIGWKSIMISSVTVASLQHLQGLDMEHAATRMKMSPFDLMTTLIEEDGGRTTIILFQLDEADLKSVLGHPLYMLGSDSIPRPTGKPHPRGHGSFPRFLARYVWEQGLVPLEEAVRHMTSQPAQRFHLWDRGVIRPGMSADLVAFTPETRDRATYDDPMRLPTGIRGVWVNGQSCFENGVPVRNRAGRVLTMS